MALEPGLAAMARPGSASCAAPRARNRAGRISRTKKLAETARDWLAPFLTGRSTLAQITSADFQAALGALLTWELCRRLDEAAPTHFEAPTGSRIAIDYTGDEPQIAVRVQELFGLDRHPAIAGGRLPTGARLAVARPASDPDHPRPARFLARLLGRCAGADARALSTTSLARRSSRCQTDTAHQGARQFRLKRLFRSDHIANHLLRQYPKARPTASSAKWSRVLVNTTV